MRVNYWLMKTEPDTFGLEHLKKRPRQAERWDGVRNFQARNFMRAMQVGDQAFFYHSSTAVPAIVAIVDIVRAAYPDSSAWERNSDHFDPKSTPEKPIWSMVDVRLARALKRPITLAELKTHAALADMRLLARGNRLSVMPVESAHWKFILTLENKRPSATTEKVKPQKTKLSKRPKER